VLDKLVSSTLARISSDGPGEDTLLDRLMQRELELLNSIWDGRRASLFMMMWHASLPVVAVQQVPQSAVIPRN
jgi:hypothetical protein